MVSTLDRFQNWYASHADPAKLWDRVQISNLSNPGWILAVELKGTELENEKLDEVEENTDTRDTWLVCGTYGPECWQREGMDGSAFIGNCGPLGLDRLLEIFVDWVESIQE